MSTFGKVALISAVVAALCFLAAWLVRNSNWALNVDVSEIPDETLRINALWDKDTGRPLNRYACEYVRRHGPQRRVSDALFFDGRLTESEAAAGKAEPDPAGISAALFNWGQAVENGDIDRKIATRRVLVATIRAEMEANQRDADRYRHLRNLPIERTGVAGQPCIALPDGPKHGQYATEEDADAAVDASMSTPIDGYQHDSYSAEHIATVLGIPAEPGTATKGATS